MATTLKLIRHYPSLFIGIRIGKPGASPWEVLILALRHAAPPQRPTVLAEWRREYPLVVPTKAQQGELAGWGLRW